MTATAFVSLITAAMSVITVAVSYLFTKKKERDADLRRYKYEQYKEFLVSLSGIVGSDSTPEGNRIFAKTCNNLHLIGSKGVLDALHAYQDVISPSSPNKSPAIEETRLSKLIWEIRQDVEIPGTPVAPDFNVHLWCSGTNPKKG